MPANLAHLLQAQAARQPDRPALLAFRAGRAHPTSFAALAQAAAQGASLLRAQGLQRGDRVLLMQPISVDLYAALGAIWQAGLIAVFIDPGMTRIQLEQAARTLAPRAYIGSPRAHLLRLLSPSLRRIPLHLVTRGWLPATHAWQQWQRTPPLGEIAAQKEEDPALITATSGSTGLPKFTTRSHGFLQRQHEAITATLALPPHATIATTLPVFILSFLAAGHTTVIPSVDLRRPGTVAMGPLVAEMQAAQTTCIAASPALLEQLVRHCCTHPLGLPHLTHIYSGGAPVFPDLLAQLHQIAPGASISAIYGATEAEPIAALDARTISHGDRGAMAAGMGLLAGRPVPSIQVQIVREQWGKPRGPLSAPAWTQQALPPTQAGEIVVAGPHVLTSVGPGEDATLTKIQVDAQTWHRTGDAGYFDYQGRLWLLGRCVARIDSGCEGDPQAATFPFTVETAVHAFPAVKHAALVAHAGQRVLVLELYEEGDSSALLAEIKRTLAWARLDALRVVRCLPVDKRHNAKVDYPALRKILDHGSL